MSENNNPPDGGIDPNTVRELQKARADLTALRAELKTARDDRDATRGERDEAIKARDGYKGQLEKQRADFEGKLHDATEAPTKAKSDADEALASVRTASDRAVIEAEAKAAATRLGAHNPADVVRLLDLSEVKRGESGEITGLDEVLTAQKEARAYMFGEAAKPGAVTGTTTTQAPPRKGEPTGFDARNATPDDYAAQKRQMLASV